MMINKSSTAQFSSPRFSIITQWTHCLIETPINESNHFKILQKGKKISPSQTQNIMLIH